MKDLTQEEMDILKQMPATVSGVKPEETIKVSSGAMPNIPKVKEEVNEPQKEQPLSEEAKLNAMLGQRVGYKQEEAARENDMDKIAQERGAVIGRNIFENTDIRDGWQHIDRSLFGERSKYYPEDWEFYIRPATVEAIRNWSTIDDENANVVDDVFNEIIKSCFKIKTAHGLLPWGNLRSWDRFFVLLLIRQFSFETGEHKLEYNEECPECDNGIKFVLDSTTLQFDLPDPEVERYFDRETCTWLIDPAEYDVEGETFTLYLPTLEKDAIIKSWIISRIQANKKVDNVFIKFLPWMANKLSKNDDVAARQIKELEMRFKSYDADMFSFMNEVINNVIVTPSTKLTTTCPTCGEEVTTSIRFPNGVSALFNITSNRKKFGKK